MTTLRTRGSTIRIAPDGAPTFTIRVEMAEVWDVTRIEAAPTQPVIEVKMAALHALFPETTAPDEMVMKLRGWEILDEMASLADCGVEDGSILLLTFRRRRPVR